MFNFVQPTTYSEYARNCVGSLGDANQGGHGASATIIFNRVDYIQKVYFDGMSRINNTLSRNTIGSIINDL